MVARRLNTAEKSVVPFRAIAWRLILFTLVWLVLCGGGLVHWLFGLPTIILATWLSLQLAETRSSSIRLSILLRFIPFFIVKSIASGFDVMVRVLHPNLPINPGIIDYPLALDHQRARIFLANSITLLPGTITADLNDQRLLVHTLDTSNAVQDSICHLEARVAELYKLELKPLRENLP